MLLHVLNNREISKNASYVNGIKSRWRIYGLYIVPILNVEANDIYLKDHTKKKQVLYFIEKNPFIEYIIEDVGWSDITIELVVKNLNI
jgi:hypothetical protein